MSEFIKMKISCYVCGKITDANLVKGNIIYPHRPDLYNLNFYQCPDCKSYVGTHKDSNKPLGSIVTKEVKNARISIHNLIDPIWKTEKIKRKKLYKKISNSLGYEYHTGNIETIKKARKIYRIILNIKMELSI